jgi:cytosine/adenosine deaminase-related metal-dependent hydrolase
MITSPAYKERMRTDRIAAQEVTALQTALKNVKKVYDAGILVALGTDSGAQPVRAQGFSEHMELELLVKAGLTPVQAITGATRNGAEVLRVDDLYGTLEPGKKANFIVLDRDPRRASETLEPSEQCGSMVRKPIAANFPTQVVQARDVSRSKERCAERHGAAVQPSRDLVPRIGR